MTQIIHPFVGRQQELNQWSDLLAKLSPKGHAVIVVGKYGMGKTWLLDQMIQQAQENQSLRCFAARYIMAPGESPGMILRMILDDMFQAARYEAGSLDAEGKRFGQWLRMYRGLGIFSNRTPTDFRFLEQLRFDQQKNIFEQFTSRLKLFSDAMPEHGRLLFAIDPELDTLAARVELWTQVVQRLPPKVIFLFAQRYKDSLSVNEEFRSQENVHFVPSQKEYPQGLSDLNEDEMRQLLDAYSPFYKGKSVDPQMVLERFRMYRHHPYAVHAALNLLCSPSFTDPDQLPTEPMPAAVCPIQWKGITEHPLHESAVRLFKTYAVLEVPTLDEMVCWVADMPPEKLKAILADPFLNSMIRSEADGRLLSHHYLLSYIRSLLYTPDGTLTEEAMLLHQRAMEGYSDLSSRSIKPDPQAIVRLAEHSLVVGGPTLFAETLHYCAESFFTLGFYQTYAALIDRALALVAPLSVEAAGLYFQLGQLRHRQGSYQAAIKHYEDSLQTARKIGAQERANERIAQALFGLGRVSMDSDHLIEANMWLQEAMTYYEVGNDRAGYAEVLMLSAEVQGLLGHTQRGEAYLNEALKVTGEMRNHRQQTKTMAAIYAAWGRMYDQMGDIERSAEQYHRALDLTKDIYDRKAEAELRTSLSSIFERVGNLKSAEEHLSKALTIHHDLKLLEHWAEDNLRLARIAEMQGKPQTRNFYIEQARRMYQQLGDKQKLEEFEDKSTTE